MAGVRSTFVAALGVTVWAACWTPFDFELEEPREPECVDKDHDSYGDNCPIGPDCDDTNGGVNPRATEIYFNGLDDDCNPNTPDVPPDEDCVDSDGDGHGVNCPVGPDCNDTDPNNYSGCVNQVPDSTNPDPVIDYCDYPENALDPVCEPTIPCDETFEQLWGTCDICEDYDLDGAHNYCYSGGDDTPLDCNDADPNNWLSCDTCEDADGDGYFVGCDNYVTHRGPDCDDSDSSVTPYFVAHLATDDGGYALVDVTDPTAPGTPVLLNGSFVGQRVAATNGYAYVAAGVDGIAVVDFRELNGVTTPVFVTMPEYDFKDVAVKGDELFALAYGGASYYGDSLLTFDIADPLDPVLTGEYYGGFWAQRIAIGDKNVYMGGDDVYSRPLTDLAGPNLETIASGYTDIVFSVVYSQGVIAIGTAHEYVVYKLDSVGHSERLMFSSSGSDVLSTYFLGHRMFYGTRDEGFYIVSTNFMLADGIVVPEYYIRDTGGVMGEATGIAAVDKHVFVSVRNGGNRGLMIINVPDHYHPGSSVTRGGFDVNGMDYARYCP